MKQDAAARRRGGRDAGTAGTTRQRTGSPPTAPTRRPKDLGAVAARDRARAWTTSACSAREPMRIALATQNVAALFDAYGKELRVIVLRGVRQAPRAARRGSARQRVRRAAGAVDGAVAASRTRRDWRHDALAGGRASRCSATGCRASTLRRHAAPRRHSTLAYDLEPLTDYLIDMHAVPKGAPASATRPACTGSASPPSPSATVAQLAGLLARGRAGATRVGPGRSRPLAGPAGRARPVTSSTRRSRPPGSPSRRRRATRPCRCCGRPTPSPQPLAVVVECSEPLWRVAADADAGRRARSTPSTRRTTGGRRGRPTGCRCRPSTAPAPAGRCRPPAIARIVRGPGGTRASSCSARAHAAREARSTSSSPPTRWPARPRRRTVAVRVAAAAGTLGGGGLMARGCRLRRCSAPRPSRLPGPTLAGHQQRPRRRQTGRRPPAPRPRLRRPRSSAHALRDIHLTLGLRARARRAARAVHGLGTRPKPTRCSRRRTVPRPATAAPGSAWGRCEAGVRRGDLRPSTTLAAGRRCCCSARRRRCTTPSRPRPFRPGAAASVTSRVRTSGRDRARCS